jgi:hypothetical protein
VNPQLTEARIDSLAELGLPIWISEYDSVNSNETVRADNLETLYRIAFSKEAVEGVLMWGFWAGSHWRGEDAAIVDLDWTINAAGQRYQSLLEEWTTKTNGVAGVQGRFDFRGVHGAYDIWLAPPGGQPTLRRLTLEPGSGPHVVTLVAHASGSKPILHNAEFDPASESFRFQLTGDAGATYAIQSLSSGTPPQWITWSNAYNPSGTIGITNTTPTPAGPQLFRAEQLP